MDMTRLPPTKEMYRALIERDSAYDGVFTVAVRTTGIFCRPTCPARKPQRENVEYFRTAGDALAAGYRPCKRCRPLEPRGKTPGWLSGLLEAVEAEPGRRWTDADIRAEGVDPVRVRRWFQENHGMTFHAYQRARRLGMALGQMRNGTGQLGAAYDHGYESLSGFREAFERMFGDTPGRKKSANQAVVTRYLTPLGPMLAAATDEGLCLLEFHDRRMLETQIKRMRQLLRCEVTPGTNEHLEITEDELTRYFEGRFERFTAPLVLKGTPFQEDVWKRLLEIPYGETLSYERLARDLGRPGAQRAVGRANGDNRLAIVVPCHRVIRSDGTLCGYGGGLWRKQHLLDLERATTGAQLPLTFGPPR
ncbi:MAG: trifunctional transcriptional activator/DNA repair protein Ada/methylated-DNA--[protein]-cysteine S-methyltransferase [Candidatus Latescibacterota bacterium]|jgi:AraC family transcriptional regulator of adaptative response/methylated-DNA-[protein]-cysteine methyltransferase